MSEVNSLVNSIRQRMHRSQCQIRFIVAVSEFSAVLGPVTQGAESAVAWDRPEVQAELKLAKAEERPHTIPDDEGIMLAGLYWDDICGDGTRTEEPHVKAEFSDYIEEITLHRLKEVCERRDIHWCHYNKDVDQVYSAVQDWLHHKQVDEDRIKAEIHQKAEEMGYYGEGEEIESKT